MVTLGRDASKLATTASAILSYYGRNTENFARRVTRRGITDEDIFYFVREQGFSVSLTQGGWIDLLNLQLPIIAKSDKKDWFLIYRIQGRRMLIHSPGESPVLAPIEPHTKSSRLSIVVIRPLSPDATPPSDRHDRLELSSRITSVRPHILRAAAFLSASQVLQFAGPISSQVIYDSIIPHREAETLISVFMIIVILFVIEQIFSATRYRINRYTSCKLEADLYASLYTAISSAPLDFLRRKKTGGISDYIRDVSHIRNFACVTSPSIVADVLSSSVGLLLLVLVGGLLSLIVVIAAVAMATFVWFALPRLRSIIKTRARLWSEVSAIFLEMSSSIETVRLVGAGAYFSKKSASAITDAAAASFYSMRLSAIFGIYLTSFLRLMSISVLFAGAFLVVDEFISIGSLIAFVLISQRVVTPLLRVSALMSEFAEYRTSCVHLSELFDACVPPNANLERLTLPHFTGSILIKGLSISYPDSIRPALVINDLEIPGGEKIAVLGRSGSGKSTFVKVLKGLVKVPDNTVLIDGMDLNSIPDSTRNRIIGVVNQENVLFTGTLLDNVTVTNRNAKLEFVMDVCRATGVDALASELPRGYATRIAERGSTLSGGQRQRISIARALIGNPRILILDEATSALDLESEAQLQQGLRSLNRQMTTIIVTHRLGMLAYANKIMVLESGLIRESGTIAELSSREGFLSNALRVHEEFSGEAS